LAEDSSVSQIAPSALRPLVALTCWIRAAQLAAAPDAAPFAGPAL